MVTVLKSHRKCNFQLCIWYSVFKVLSLQFFNCSSYCISTIFCGVNVFFSKPWDISVCRRKKISILWESINNLYIICFWNTFKTDVCIMHVKCAYLEASDISLYIQGEIAQKLSSFTLWKARNQWQITSRAELQWQLFIISLSGFYHFTPPSWR